LVSYTRANGEAVGIDPNVGYMQRHERAVWIGVSTVISPIFAAYIEPDLAHPSYHLAVVALALVAVITNITEIWLIRLVMRALRPARAEQAVRLAAGSFTTAPRVELLRRIAQVAPAPHLRRTQLYSGGAEAVESALRLARAHTGRYETIGFWGGFHGKTGGVL